MIPDPATRIEGARWRGTTIDTVTGKVKLSLVTRDAIIDVVLDEGEAGRIAATLPEWQALAEQRRGPEVQKFAANPDAVFALAVYHAHEGDDTMLKRIEPDLRSWIARATFRLKE